MKQISSPKPLDVKMSVSNASGSKLRGARGGTASNKRRGEMPVPMNLRELLNQEQMASVRQMESFGWRLAFVRRPSSETPVAIVESTDGRSYGTLEIDGTINTEFSVGLRGVPN